MRLLLPICLSAALFALPDAGAAPRHVLTIDDMLAVRDVSDIDLSPDGAWVAYTVSSADITSDESGSDIWMSSWDGRRQVQLTASKESDSQPRFSLSRPRGSSLPSDRQPPSNLSSQARTRRAARDRTRGDECDPLRGGA